MTFLTKPLSFYPPRLHLRLPPPPHLDFSITLLLKACQMAEDNLTTPPLPAMMKTGDFSKLRNALAFRIHIGGFLMKELSLLSASCILALFLASCGGGSSGGGGGGGVVDTDGDGIPDSKDLCKNSIDENFISSSTTDADKDGCKDDDPNGEDQDRGNGKDKDNDGKVGADDKCPQGETNWTSISTSTDPAVTITDNDSDGCRDAGEDVDDDNNGLIEIATALELNNIRHDLDGTHYDEDEDDSTNIGSNTGCSTTNPVGCNGYELAGDIDISSIINFVPIGSLPDPFSAILQGNDYTISNLKIATDNPTRFTGFFAVLGTNSTVRNLSFEMGSVSSSNGNATFDNVNYVGVLAGTNKGTISGVSADISVSASEDTFNYVGGLVSHNSGTISSSHATGSATVSAAGGKLSLVGGLVSANFGIISSSSATGSATGGGVGNNWVGGLVGYNSSTIQDSYATGFATGGANSDFVGGLVGDNFSGTISSSHATGKADGGGGGDFVGGLVGYHEFHTTIIRNSYATGKADGGAGDDIVGGLVGSNENTIKNSYATGKADGGAGDDIVGGLVGFIANASTTISNSYALGTVDGGADGDEVGRLLGKKGTGSIGTITITSNYYDSGSSLTGESPLSLPDTEALGRTKARLKANNNVAPDSDTACSSAGGTWSSAACTYGHLDFSTDNWDFTADKYPSLRSYKTTTDTSTPPVVTQIAGDLLCGQLPEADFVQCPPSTTP